MDNKNKNFLIDWEGLARLPPKVPTFGKRTLLINMPNEYWNGSYGYSTFNQNSINYV